MKWITEPIDIWPNQQITEVAVAAGQMLLFCFSGYWVRGTRIFGGSLHYVHLPKLDVVNLTGVFRFET